MGTASSGPWPGEAPLYAALRARVAALLRYPPMARRQGLTGTAVVEVVILPTGRVASARLVESTSYSILDEAALEAVRGVGMVPLPAGLPPASALRAVLPVVFEQR